MKLIIGLGNPGGHYKYTRHNIGFLVLDEIAGKEKFKADKNSQAELLKTENYLLAKPQTFMNNSGSAVNYLMIKNKIKADNLIVIHDDKDLDFGKIKIQQGASSAGHRGVQNIIEKLGTKEFTRVRIGVKNKDLEKMPTDQFVLKKFSFSEKRELKKIIKQVIEELKKII